MELFAETAKRLFGSIVGLRHGLVENDHDNAAAARLWSARNLKTSPHRVKVRRGQYIYLKIQEFFRGESPAAQPDAQAGRVPRARLATPYSAARASAWRRSTETSWDTPRSGMVTP